MLQIPEHIVFNKGRLYTVLAERYLPEAATLPSISVAEQDAAMQPLNSQLKNEQFYTITDVKTGEITYCNGISRWLGHAHTHFTRKKYLASIHSAHALIHGFYAISLFDVLIKRQIAARFLSPISVTTLALKHKNGKYVYCKIQCSPWQLTQDGRVKAYLSEFTIVKDFAGESYSIRLWNDGNTIKDIIERLKKVVQREFETASLFSVQELRILKRYASMENATSEMIAAAFKIKKATVNTFNKRIMKKAEKAFDEIFSTAKEVAEYFKSADLI